MEYRTLGSTGLEVSVVGVGTWQFGGEWAKEFEQAEVTAMFDRAGELGINLVDTAECYGDHLSEELVGEARAGRRDDWIIATKFGHVFHEPFERDTVYDPEKVLKQLEDSLTALQTDYIDLYQFHSGSDDHFQTEGLWEMLREQQEKGRIRHLGISIGSNTNAFQTGQAPEVGAEAIQVIYNRLDQAPEEEVFPLCEEHDLGVLARVPLASGFLSGKYKPGDEDQFDPDDVRGRWKDPADIRKQLERVQEIRQREVPDNAEMAPWALGWCLRNPAVTTVIPGCKNVEQVESNARAVDYMN